MEIKTNKLPKTIKWYKNGIEIVPNLLTEKIFLNNVSDTEFQLKILDVNLDDDANYTVRFNN